MDIIFYYVKGLNKTDTMRFDTIEQQQDYLEEHIVLSYNDNAFYPPHYTFDLRVSTEDITFNTSINYLSLYYDNKYYYYFINNIKYINEGIIALTLEMDTIQTYMFNINKVSGLLERTTIDRWNVSQINRDYIRENFSLAETIKNESLTKLEPSVKANIALILTEYTPKDPDWSLYSATNGNNTISKATMYACSFVTQPNYPEVPIVTYKIGTEEFVNVSPSTMGKSAYAIKQFYIEDITMIGIKYSINGSTLTLQNNINGIQFTTYKIDDVNTLFLSGQNFKNTTYTNTVDNVFKANYSKTTKFNYKYVPYLFDSYYTKYFIGNIGIWQQVPVEQMNTKWFTTYTTFDATTGKSMVALNKFGYNYNFFYISTVEPEIEIVSSPYMEYTSRNSSMIQLKNIIGLQQTLMGMGTTAIPSMNFSTSSSFTDYAWRGKGHYLNYSNTDSASINPNIRGANQILNGINQIAENKATVKDALNSPGAVKAYGTAFSSFAYDGIVPYVYTYEVQDIDLCARKVERLGYKVNKYVEYDNIYSYNNRYYYNVLQFGDDLNINLDILQDNTTIENIKYRLRNGIRLWNVTNSDVIMQDYTYDNVENKNV